MKVKIRKTGEIVDVIAWSQNVDRDDLDYVSYVDSKGVEHPKVRGMNFYWDFEKLSTEEETAIDWEQRRYEIAKVALQAIISNDSSYKYHSDMVFKTADKILCEDGLPYIAIEYADKLIEELKKKKQ